MLKIRQVQNNDGYLGTDYGIDDISFSAVNIPNSDFGLATDFCWGVGIDANQTRLEAYNNSIENTYSWLAGNGDSQTGQGNYSFTKQFNGTYTISLTVTNICGGSSTTTKTLFLPGRSRDYNQFCCLQTMSYDIEVNTNLTTAVTNWTAPKTINATIYIKPGKTLNITGTTISFGLKGRIIVEQGATLNVSNSTLGGINTSACQGMWEGIEVWGYDGNAQTSTYQGKLVISGTSQINDAHKAVFVGKRNNCYNIVTINSQTCPINDPEIEPGFGGGIIDIQGATFNRNGVDIQIVPYSPFTPQTTNPMIIKGNNFAGGIIKDYRYRYHRPPSDVYQYTWSYPTSGAPYYAPASRDGSGRTPIHIKMYGVNTNINIQDNIFNNAEYGIDAVNAKFNVTKSTNGNGNEFKNLKFGISILNPIATTIYPHTISDNKFIKIENAIRIVNGRYEVVRNNEFGLSDLTSIRTDNRLGIYLQNTSMFNVIDNFFYRLDSAIYVVESGLTGGRIESDPFGNNFIRCLHGVVTSGNNENLQIRCGFHNNENFASGEYNGKNWLISGILANQGGTSDYKSPAGNEFYPPQLKEITTTTNFTYNRHRWGVLGTGDLSILPTTSVHSTSTFIINNTLIDKNPYSCSNEVPCNPCDRPIDDNTQEKQQLESDYENMLLVLDDNNTAQLLMEINTFNLNSEQLKNLLITSSPLSDIVIAALLENYTRLNQTHFVSVMEHNLPVNAELWPALEYISSSFSSNYSAFIADQQFNSNSNPTLTSIERDYIRVINERQQLIAQAVKLEVDTNETKAMNRLLSEENENRQLAVGTYLSKNNNNEAQFNMSYISTNNVEDADWVELSNIQLNLQQQGKDWFGLDSSQQVAIRRIAQGEGKAASGASAVLHLVFKEDFKRKNSTNTTMFIKNPAKLLVKLVEEKENKLMLVYPNPSASVINIPYKMTDKNGSIEIRGILGNLIETKMTEKGYNLITLDVSDYATGIYFITLKDASGKFLASQKISIQH